MTPTSEQLFDALDATWPPESQRPCGPFVLRSATGGGSRVNAALLTGALEDAALDAAEAQMPAPLFQVRRGQEALDQALAARGYRIKDPSLLYAISAGEIAEKPQPVSLLSAWPPLAMQRQVWADGGVGTARIAVMERACAPKESFIARFQNRVAGTAFAAIHNGIAMMHALQVEPEFRHQGVAGFAVRGMAYWALQHGASTFALAVTQDNTAARNLYTALGMTEAGAYHYREKST